MSEIVIINGRCMDCLGEDHNWAGCGCWCHDTCLDCGRAECTEKGFVDELDQD